MIDRDADEDYESSSSSYSSDLEAGSDLDERVERESDLDAQDDYASVNTVVTGLADYSNFSREEIRDALLFNLNFAKNRKPGVKKYAIRGLLEYFHKELKEAAESMAIVLADDAISHYLATNFVNL